jgi:hypothetical protein
MTERKRGKRNICGVREIEKEKGKHLTKKWENVES